MRPRRGSVCLYALLIAALPSFAEPGESAADPKDDRRFTLGLATWQSQGTTDFAHDASEGNPLLGNPTSKLHYSGLDSLVMELQAELRLGWRMSLSGRGGFGSVSGGTLIDDDFLSAQGAAYFGTSLTGEHRYSSTESLVEDDDLDYLEIKLARHLLSRKKPRRSRLRLFGSARTWSENLIATGVQQLACTSPFVLCGPPGPPIPSLVGEPAIGESSDWFVGLVGLEGEWRSGRRFEASWRLGFGLAEVEADDIHYLRTDLAQDPSFRWTGDGTALELEAVGHYRLSPRFRLGLGYRIWKASADDGTVVQFDNAGGVGTATLLEYEADRNGVLLYIEHRSAR